MKGNVWKCLFAFSALCILVGAVGLWLTYKKPIAASAERTLLQEQAFNMEGISHFKISANLASIHLKEGSAAEVEVRLFGKPEQDSFEYHIEEVRKPGQTEMLELQIVTGRHPKLSLHSFFAALGSRDAHFATMAEVYLPAHLMDTVEVSTMVGDIEAVELVTNELILSSELGKIELAHVQGTDILVESSVGEIYLTNIAAPLKVNSNVGKVSWTNARPEHPVDIRTDVGDVKVNLHQAPITLELEVLLGTIQTDSSTNLPRVEQEEGTYVHGSIGTGGPLVKVLTHVGNIQVEAAP
ncbi:DUF4097 family beta strand repeat-containing protein [Paenibacillus senegalensis]|uniref:DUF4097 family beta strand repeat-containing protein n=1 Tax=Paenibacillus senegalensis TaxID=1465766 RepID=UPI000289AED7|nr:DUF4097 family beta strand repeat-containing protein [Paenibacillus senegalensis]